MRIGSDIVLLRPEQSYVDQEVADEQFIEGNTIAVINPGDGLAYNAEAADAAGVTDGKFLVALEDIDSDNPDQIGSRSLVTGAAIKLTADGGLDDADIHGTPAYLTGETTFTTDDQEANLGQVGVVFQRIRGNTSEAYVQVRPA